MGLFGNLVKSRPTPSTQQPTFMYKENNAKLKVRESTSTTLTIDRGLRESCHVSLSFCVCTKLKLAWW